ncbi:hypothetical protein QVD17_07117 [Tagetes erecta]|uniref:Uncharacterized protein n=1 Tax=Tagetes erecta TaxID=13708 RepID=A0AAD8PCQ4_TARER|nr:hypothetical protein QVD17_07117 [Tagetes erecta]
MKFRSLFLRFTDGNRLLVRATLSNSASISVLGVANMTPLLLFFSQLILVVFMYQSSIGDLLKAINLSSITLEACSCKSRLHIDYISSSMWLTILLDVAATDASFPLGALESM